MKKDIIKIIGENEDGTLEVEVQDNHPEYIELKKDYEDKFGELNHQEFVTKLIEDSVKEMINMEKEDPEKFKSIMEKVKNEL